MNDVAGAGRGIPRPALFAGIAVVVAGLAWLAAGGGPTTVRRGPIAVPNPDAEPETEFLVGRVRHVVAADAPARLLPDTVFPEEPARLLWLQGRTAAPLARGGVVVPDGAGGLVRFDERLALGRPLALAGRELLSAAGTRDGSIWVADAEGAVLRVGPDGTQRSAAAVPFDYPALAADPAREDVWLVRSAHRWNFRVPSGAPLLVRLDPAGVAVGELGATVVPAERLLSEFASSGHLAVSGDTVYFAPFIRDEVIAFSRSGDTLWVASRELPQSTAQPRFEVAGGSPTIEYYPVNLGLAVGPDQRLYVLSTPGFTTGAGRLDVFDRVTGTLVRSATLPTALPTIAADAGGRVYLLEEFRLLAGTPPDLREPFADFALDRLGGGRMTLADLRGKVTLINFWASWCHPCRTEMPALDRLRREIAEPDFLFLTMNEDVNSADAEAFMRELGFDFPVLLGRGRLRERYHYLGLPYTVLLDRDGKVVQRWLGFAGHEQILAEKSLIRAELERGAATASTASTRHQH
ncbi:MAG: redoxin domain-containing protein [Gemmatimonadetes bacterium]|nr:redoxin domain-containing protein [Gemmatimonadota bacterium]